MQGALRHRGPDDEGNWRSASGEASFAHTRLSIIDLSGAAHQPMRAGDGRFTIVFNGEIYNFAALRQALESTGAQFSSRSDTEVIIRAYEVHGPACVSMLRGMFAFALWDERERTCLLARDRFGIKPLYYRADANGLVFASEVRALLASGLVAKDLDAEGVYGYFRSGSVPEPNTLLRDVRCLEAGQFAVWQGGRLLPQRYWQLGFSPESIEASDAVAATRAALLDSVEHHFVSDVPVGIFLSGGIDSTALVALARATGRSDLHTFSIAFPGSSGDEGGIARRTAAHFGTHHDEWPMTAAEGKELFGRFLGVLDQPSIDGFNTYAVSKLAHEHGMKVVLSGVGGDELFGGYKSFRDVPRLARWNRRLAALGPIRSGISAALRHGRPPQWRRLGDMLRRPPDLESAYAALRGIFTPDEANVLARKYTGGTADPLLEDRPGACDNADEQDVVSCLEVTRYMRNQLLRDADVASMAWGLELRVPYLDSGLAEALERIPAAIRLRPGKRLLLEAVPEVPEWVASQPKRGFLFPFERWLEEDWQDTFRAVERESPVSAGTWYRKWCIDMFDRWIERLN